MKATIVNRSGREFNHFADWVGMLGGIIPEYDTCVLIDINGE